MVSRRNTRRSQTDGAAATRRAARKLAKATEHSHSATENRWVGPTIYEQLKARVVERADNLVAIYAATKGDEDEEYTAVEWVDVEKDRARRRARAQGELRGAVVALGLMRTPFIASEMGQERTPYTTGWWNWVKRVEKKAVLNAKARAEG
jgi:hypothetical protein